MSRRGKSGTRVAVERTREDATCRQDGNPNASERLADFDESAMVLRSVLTAEECAAVLPDIESVHWVSANRNGRPLQDGAEACGSYRATAFDESVAEAVWQRLRLRLPFVRTMRESTPTDWNSHPVWRPVGINPMLRFIHYEKAERWCRTTTRASTTRTAAGIRL